MFLDVKLQGVPDLSSFGDVYELGFGLGPDQPPTSAIVKKEFQRKILYQLSPQEVLVFQYQTLIMFGAIIQYFLLRYIFSLFFYQQYSFSVKF